jgi:hypothetical protein
MSRLLEFFEERLAQLDPPPSPLEMGVKPPQTIRLPIETIGNLKLEQKQRIKRIKKKMKKYFLF